MIAQEARWQVDNLVERDEGRRHANTVWDDAKQCWADRGAYRTQRAYEALGEFLRALAWGPPRDPREVWEAAREMEALLPLLDPAIAEAAQEKAEDAAFERGRFAGQHEGHEKAIKGLEEAIEKASARGYKDGYRDGTAKGTRKDRALRL